MQHRKVFEKINEQRGRVLAAKFEEIEELLRPYTKVLPNSWEEVIIPNEEIALKYDKLNKEFQDIVVEINLMDKN